MSSPPPGVCGPDVTAELETIWTKIQSDFRSWTPDQRSDACSRILIPLKMPVWTPGTDPKTFIRSVGDINGWDVMPLYQGASLWLRSYPIYDAATGGPCATPSSTNPIPPPLTDLDKYKQWLFDDAHESDQTCSNSVQVGGQCWLNGTANYGTFGIMVRLCRDEFPVKFMFALKMAETLIKTYKAIGPHPEDPALPIAWLLATFNGGPTGKPVVAGNRPQCKCTCPSKGSITTWDYVWEPVKQRVSAMGPTIPAKPTAPPVPPVAPSPSTAGKTYTVAPGDSLAKIANAQYGDAKLWPKIYAANKTLIGLNPNKLAVGQKLNIP
ncbi:MAG: LysM peptidoglycan-binding domain-containing protein [Bryobacteraceae bacterium]|nr:LysM peptidoglycan-binding domain-containing protein [Bryobacteraceae bacterium]